MKRNKVLVLAAHPDDETLGLGATLKKLSDEGSEIQLITFTDGEGARGSLENRNKKLKDVAKFLGIEKYNFGNFPDNAMDTVPFLEIVKFLEKNVEIDPDIIFTHHKNCLNIDHRLVYQATLTAFRPQYGKKIKVYSYFVPSSTDYNPFSNFLGNVYFDVKEYKDSKLECLKKFYKKELRSYPHTRSIESIENIMKVWGTEVGLEYAEKFELVRSVS